MVKLPMRMLRDVLVGAFVAFVPLYADYRFALWFQSSLPRPYSVAMAVSMALGAAGVFVLFLLISVLGIIGERVTNVFNRYLDKLEDSIKQGNKRT